MKTTRTIREKFLAIVMAMSMLSVLFLPTFPVHATSTPVPTGWTEVKTAAEFKDALEDSTTTQIIFGANIAMQSGGVIINNTKPSLVIDGNGFTLTEYTSNNQSHTIRMAALGTLTTVTVQNMRILGRNQNGTFSSPKIPVTFIYKSIRYSGPGFAHHQSGTVRLIDCDIALLPGINGVSAYAANANKVYLEGTVDIVKESSTSTSPIVFVSDKDGGITVTKDAVVRISSNRNSNNPVANSPFVHYNGTGGYLLFEKDSYFNYAGNNMFANREFRYVTVDENAQVYISIYGVLNQFGIMSISDLMNVNKSSVLDMRAYKNNALHPVLQPRGYGTVNINNPREVFIYNSSTASNNPGGLAIGPPVQVAVKDDINYNDIFSIEYWKFNKNAPDALATATRIFKNNDNTSFSATLVTSTTSSLVTSAIAWRYKGDLPFTLANVNMKDINVIRILGDSAGTVDQGNIVVIHQDADTQAELDRELFTIPAGAYGPYLPKQDIIDSGYTFKGRLASSDPESGTINKGETKTIVFAYSKPVTIDEGNVIVIHQDAESGAELDRELFTVLAGAYGPYAPKQSIIDAGYTFKGRLVSSDPESGTINKDETKTIVFTYSKTNVEPDLDIEGIVLWEGDAYARPDFVVVILFRNGLPIQVIPVFTDGDGKFTFTGLPRYDANGDPYSYTVAQFPLAGFDTTVDGYTIKNALQQP